MDFLHREAPDKFGSSEGLFNQPCSNMAAKKSEEWESSPHLPVRKMATSLDNLPWYPRIWTQKPAMPPALLIIPKDTILQKHSVPQIIQYLY